MGQHGHSLGLPPTPSTPCAAGVGAAIWEESYDHAIQSSHRSRCCHSCTLRHERPRCHFGFGCFILVGGSKGGRESKMTLSNGFVVFWSCC